MMTTLLKRILLSLLTAAAFHAHAQRTPVPVVDFKDIPIASATARALTEEQVRQAISSAAILERWEVVPKGNNVLQATFVKEGKHTVVVDISYSADRYSLTYKDSINMKASAATAAAGGITRTDTAAESQRKIFVQHPETAYAVVRPDVVIHPFYEVWVRRLIDMVGRQIRVLPA